MSGDEHSDDVSRQQSLLEPPAFHSRRSRLEKRRLRFPEPQVQPQPIPGIPSPVAAASEQPLPTLSVSPPPRDAQSPATEIALLPGGGVEIPSGFRFQQEDQGRYRPSDEDDEGGSGHPRVLGGLGLGIFKNLMRFPAALARVGRGDRSREDSELYTPPESYVGQLPIDDDVETYFTQAEEDENRARQQEDLLNEYVQRNRKRRDHAWRRLRNVDRERYVPAPQPIPVPGSRAPSAVGYAEPASALEAEEMAEEAERLARAQEYERSRNIYAAQAVRPPLSPSRSRTSRRAHHRVASTPLPTRIFSHWAAERDSMGRRLENRSDSASASDASTFSFAGLLRFIRQVRDLPWVGDRVAADYIPGGLRASYSDSQAMSGTSYVSPAPLLPLPPSKSWYAHSPQDSILLLPEGVDPPDGFIPYPYEYPPPMVENRAPSRSSQTHVDSSIPVYPPNPPYGEGEIYHYMPAEASTTGKSYVFIPSQQNGRGAYASRRPRTPGG